MDSNLFGLEPEHLYGSIYSNTKLKMDGIKLLDGMGSEQIKTIFFDPQYRGILDKMKYGNEGKKEKRRSQLVAMDDDKIIEFIKLIDRVLTPSGHLFMWVDKFHLVSGVNNWIGACPSLEIVDMITWNKEKMGMGYRSRRTSEHLLVIQKKPKRAKGVWKIHNIRDVWSERVNARVGNHPHKKPIELQKILILATTELNDNVVDPCAGSFSVMESANAVGRNFIGCDIDCLY